MMKKLNVLFLSVVALGATVSSCSKEEDTSKMNIEGKWTYDTYTYTDAEGITDAPKYAYDPNCQDRKYFYFKSKGVLEFGISNPSDNPTNPCKFYKYIGAWSLQDKTISTTVEGDTKQLALVSVSSTDLVFRYPRTGDEYYMYTLKKNK